METTQTLVAQARMRDLEHLLMYCDIPAARRDVSLVVNLRWLQRNLTIRNHTPDAHQAMAIINRLLREVG